MNPIEWHERRQAQQAAQARAVRPEDDRAGLLREALAIVEGVRQCLDTAEAPACPSCGSAKHRRFGDWKADEQLAGAETRLRKAIQHLEWRG